MTFLDKGFDFEGEYNKLCEKHVATEKIFDGVILHVIRDDVKVPSGRMADRELIRHGGAVCIIPVLDDGRVVVERQFRYPLDKVITEIPAGKLDFIGEDRLEAAKRELREETGYNASEWIELGDFYPAPAYSDERITMYLARGLEKGERDLDEDEFIDISLIPIKDLVGSVMRGEIVDAKTQMAILRAARILEV